MIKVIRTKYVFYRTEFKREQVQKEESLETLVVRSKLSADECDVGIMYT